MATTAFDVIVIGSGPGGYVAAIRAAQLGLKTAIVEKETALGGTCLNVGCIPSKALLDSTEHLWEAQHHFAEHGIEITGVKPNLKQMIERKRGVVAKTVEGVNFLMKKNKIEVLTGLGSFVDSKTVRVTAADGKTTDITGKNIIIATGSAAASLPGVNFDGKRIISSTEALELTEIPKTLIVIGGGVIGLELGSVYGRLGSKIVVVEYAGGLIPTMDGDLGKELQKVLKKQIDIEYNFNHKVQKVEAKGKTVTVTALDKDGKEVTFTGDYCLLSVGRKPYTDGLGLDKAGVAVDARGRVEVDHHLQTNVPGIYAIGDVVKGAMLAHKASEEGVFVAEVIAGKKPHINYLAIPGVVYTWPEVASVGYTTEELKEKGIPFKVGKFPFMASGRARAALATDGFVKVLAHKDTDEILGIHMIGPRTADMIGAAVVSMEFRASAEDIGIASAAHPTFMECLKEAALDATEKRAIHM